MENIVCVSRYYGNITNKLNICTDETKEIGNLIDEQKFHIHRDNNGNIIKRMYKDMNVYKKNSNYCGYISIKMYALQDMEFIFDACTTFKCTDEEIKCCLQDNMECLAWHYPLSHTVLNEKSTIEKNRLEQLYTEIEKINIERTKDKHILLNTKHFNGSSTNSVLFLYQLAAKNSEDLLCRMHQYGVIIMKNNCKKSRSQKYMDYIVIKTNDFLKKISVYEIKYEINRIKVFGSNIGENSYNFYRKKDGRYLDTIHIKTSALLGLVKKDSGFYDINEIIYCKIQKDKWVIMFDNNTARIDRCNIEPIDKKSIDELKSIFE